MHTLDVDGTARVTGPVVVEDQLTADNFMPIVEFESSGSQVG